MSHRVEGFQNAMHGRRLEVRSLEVDRIARY